MDRKQGQLCLNQIKHTSVDIKASYLSYHHGSNTHAPSYERIWYICSIAFRTINLLHRSPAILKTKQHYWTTDCGWVCSSNIGRKSEDTMATVPAVGRFEVYCGYCLSEHPRTLLLNTQLTVSSTSMSNLY